jgi:hypothetical protein
MFHRKPLRTLRWHRRNQWSAEKLGFKNAAWAHERLADSLWWVVVLGIVVDTVISAALLGLVLNWLF